MESMLNEYVIIRGDRSGVFAGKLISKAGAEVVLADCRRLWYWAGAASISQLAVDGPARPGECKFTVTIPHICITDVIEIIPCSEKAEASIKAVPEWKM